MSYPPGNLFIPGTAGPLECLLWRSETPAGWAVVSHPHPRYGGTMHNKVVYRMARALQGAGLSVLRYNFRGVGGSAGAHDEGRGEAEDLRAALCHLSRVESAEPFLLAGFSFGAWINARVGCPDPRAARLLQVGLVSAYLEKDAAAFRCPKPTAVVQGDLDQFGEWAKVEALCSSLPRSRLLRVEGADHFFSELDRALSEAIRWLLAEE